MIPRLSLRLRARQGAALVAARAQSSVAAVGWARAGTNAAELSVGEDWATAQEVLETSGKHTPYGQLGSGLYSTATRGCFDVMGQLTPLVLEAVDKALHARRLEARSGRPFRIADFGTADAGTSMRLVREMVAAVREAEPNAAVEIVYEDQPGNDWASVFKRTQGAISTQGATEGLSDLDNCFIFASGTSFYRSCLPAHSVDVAFSSTAMHWLTDLPTAIPDALHSACTNDPAAKAAFAARAAADWQTILAARARELRPGGSLVMANFATDEAGQFLGRTHRMKYSMHHMFCEIWRGLVTPEEFEATNFPNEYRSLEACVAPFGPDGKASFHGLQLASAQTNVVACPFLNSYLDGSSGLSAERHALEYIPTTRTWSNSTFLSGLDRRKRSERECEGLVDQLFTDYAAAVAMDPTQHGMDYVHSYLSFEKHDDGIRYYF